MQLAIHWRALEKSCVEGRGYRHGDGFRVRVSIDIIDRRHSRKFLSEGEPRSWQPTEWTRIHIRPIGKELIHLSTRYAVSSGKSGF